MKKLTSNELLQVNGGAKPVPKVNKGSAVSSLAKSTPSPKGIAVSTFASNGKARAKAGIGDGTTL